MCVNFERILQNISICSIFHLVSVWFLLNSCLYLLEIKPVSSVFVSVLRNTATAPLTHIFLVTMSVIDINWPIVATHLQYKHTIWSLGATKDCSITRLLSYIHWRCFFLPYVGLWDWSTDAKIFASKLCNKWFWHAFI